MEIRIQFFGRVFSLCIGHQTDWFEQIPFFMLAEEWRENKQVVYAKMIWSFWR